MKKNVYYFLTLTADAAYILFAFFQQVFTGRNKTVWLLLFLLMSAISTDAQSPLTNGDFETWNTISKTKVQGWRDNNVYKPKAVTFVTKVAGVSGNAVRLETILSGIMPTSGAVYNYTGTLSQGGAKYTGSGIPKRFKGYYRYNIAKDSALMYLVFKRNGVVLSMDTFYVPAGAKASFTAFDFAISSAMTVVPDTVVFGAIGGTFNLSNFTTNAKVGDFIELDELSFANGATTYSFPNGDFETWSNINEESLNIWQAGGSVTKTTDKYSGSFAAKMVTQDNGSGVEAGILYGSTVNLTTNADTLVGYFKYASTGGDQAYVEITFWDHNGTGASEAKGFLLNPAATYYVFSIPLVNSINASDFNFQIKSSYNNPVTGSTLIVDNLQLRKGKVTGIANASKKSSMLIYPNPAMGLVHISLPQGNAEGILTVHNSLGQVVLQSKLNDDKIDVSNWQNGVYNFKFTNGNHVYHDRLEVRH